jgi:hypothetical protein
VIAQRSEPLTEGQHLVGLPVAGRSRRTARGRISELLRRVSLSDRDLKLGTSFFHHHAWRFVLFELKHGA